MKEFLKFGKGKRLLEHSDFPGFAVEIQQVDIDFVKTFSFATIYA